MWNSHVFFFLFGLSCPIMSRFIFASLISSVTEWEMAAWFYIRKTGLNKRQPVKRKKKGLERLGSRRAERGGFISPNSVGPSCSHNRAALIPSNMFHIYVQTSAGCWMRPLLSWDLRSTQLADNSRFPWDEELAGTCKRVRGGTHRHGSHF